MFNEPEGRESHRNPDAGAIRHLLASARRIAVVGLSPKPHRDSNRVARYLRDRGYEIVPVYPREDEILGSRVYRRIVDIPAPVDIVDVFRRSEELPGVVEDAIEARVPALWLQLGCVHEAAARRARDSGLVVVMDRCIMVDHSRTLGSAWSVLTPASDTRSNGRPR